MRREAFDVVLMDVQMPIMDGLEATAKIRQAETPSGRHTPIVGVTASAMKGDRERCLAAGMAGYVAKPLRSEELFAALDESQSLPQASDPGDRLSVPAPKAGHDLEEALSRVGGDEGLLTEVVSLFLEQAPVLIAQIRESIEKGDPKQLERAAHKLKGSTGVLTTSGPFEAAAELEAMGRRGDLSSSAMYASALEDGIRRLFRALGPA